ncbi:hypothetical protein Brsp05_04623 [Brucella sp. NBRC 12953]
MTSSTAPAVLTPFAAPKFFARTECAQALAGRIPSCRSRRPPKTIGDGQQPLLPIATAAPIDGDGLQAEIDRQQKHAGGDADLARDRGSQEAPEPKDVLKDGKLAPGIEGDDRLQNSRKVVG